MRVHSGKLCLWDIGSLEVETHGNWAQGISQRKFGLSGFARKGAMAVKQVMSSFTLFAAAEALCAL